MTLMLFSPHNFVHLTCCCHWLQEIKVIKFWWSLMVAFTQNFVKIVQLIQKLKGTTCTNYGSTVSPIYLLASLNKKQLVQTSLLCFSCCCCCCCHHHSHCVLYLYTDWDRELPTASMLIINHVYM